MIGGNSSGFSLAKEKDIFRGAVRRSDAFCERAGVRI